MAAKEPLYLGFDLSTQQLKGIAVTSDLRVAYQAKFDFDADSTGYGVHKGVITNEELHEVYAPVALWLQALDALLASLKQQGLDFGAVKGISGACQQHGSVFWSHQGEAALEHLDATKKLEDQLGHAFSHPFSPNWQDASTQAECDEFDAALGSPEALAEATGSKAHHRFTGPQILRFRKRHPDAYAKTARISLVSSFLASVLLGRIAPIDISDVGGMNLWHLKQGRWDPKLLELTSGGQADDLLAKLGQVPESGGDSFGPVAPYFVQRYGFDAGCQIVPFTGDNPSTILAAPLRPLDAIVSLGTSTTFLMSTPQLVPDPAVHFMNHPTTAGLYMFMLCYKNGGLAREQIRDAINADSSYAWAAFDRAALAAPKLGQRQPADDMKMGLYFRQPEIVPNLRAGTWRYVYSPQTGELAGGESVQDWPPEADARAIVESQMLSLRLRSRELVKGLGSDQSLPPQPRRIYLVGGGSRNAAIAKIAGEVLGGVEGIYKLDVGENACALGAAYKAVWACERTPGQTFEDLIGARWHEEEFAQRLETGYQEGIFEQYGKAVEGFELMEQKVLSEQNGK